VKAGGVYKSNTDVKPSTAFWRLLVPNGVTGEGLGVHESNNGREAVNCVSVGGRGRA
jgi:hypothetical protein